VRTVTLDTNILPPERVIVRVPASQFDFAVVSVSEREIAASSFQVAVVPLKKVAETELLDESVLDQGVLGSAQDVDCFEASLAIISNNSFPKPHDRNRLTPGQRRQLRDAMIFCAHVRARRDIFVTKDRRAFVEDGRRETLERRFKTKIMTDEEFLAAFESRRCEE